MRDKHRITHSLVPCRDPYAFSIAHFTDFCFGYGDLQEIYPEIPMAHPWQIRYDPSTHILSV